jgi:DNA-binding SARP family transcriptional activator
MLAIPRRQVRALLYRLAVDMRPVPREHLYWLLWPDGNDVDIHRDFSHLLTHLRHALPNQEMVQDADAAIYLHSDLVWSDASAFQHLTQFAPVDSSAALGRLPKPKAAHAASMDLLPFEYLEEAVELYRGPLLDGFVFDGSAEYESWMILQRSALEQHYLDVLKQLIDSVRAQNGPHKTVNYLHRALKVDPMDEVLHQQLIEFYLSAGNRSAAIRQFEACRDILQREMGIDPMPETNNLYLAALNGLP